MSKTSKNTDKCRQSFLVPQDSGSGDVRRPGSDSLTDLAKRGHDAAMGKPRLLLGVVLVGCGGAAEPTEAVPPLDATAVDAWPFQDGTAVVDETPTQDANTDGSTMGTDVTPIQEVDAEDAGEDSAPCDPPYALSCPAGYGRFVCANPSKAYEQEGCVVALESTDGTFYCCPGAASSTPADTDANTTTADVEAGGTACVVPQTLGADCQTSGGVCASGEFALSCGGIGPGHNTSPDPSLTCTFQGAVPAGIASYCCQCEVRPPPCPGADCPK